MNESSRDYGMEIDQLKTELKEIKELLNGLTSKKKMAIGKAVPGGHIQKMPEMHSDPAIMNILDQLENAGNSAHSTGAISYVGVFASGNRQSTWIRHLVNTDDLLKLIEDNTAQKLLACIGNNDRLKILLAILRKPMTVAQLVSECGYNSTGQVYHHLKPLIAADIVEEGANELGKGHYVVKPHRVQGIIMLLAGISDIIDPEYTHFHGEQ